MRHLDDEPYLRAMHDILEQGKSRASVATVDPVQHFIRIHSENLSAYRTLSPPASLAEAHAEIVKVSEAIRDRLRQAGTLEELGASEDLRDIVERGAAAFRVLQRESDRLGLGLSFR